MKISKNHPVIAWWSGGVISAVVCKICIDLFGKENVRVVFIDTKNEADDTYTFLLQCEQWYGIKIEVISSTEYDNIEDIWYDSMSLGLAKGAKCTEILKIKVRQQFIKQNAFSYNAFGYDISEISRATDMNKNNPHLRPIYPAMAKALSKKDCIKIIQNANDMFLHIEVPKSYRRGLHNNNCFKTGCIKGGIGYWQWMQVNEPQKFDAMAIREHEISDLKGEPVTVLKDQAKDGGLLFLKHNPKFPDIKDISCKPWRPVETLMPECNGFCNAA
jgi:hypothetical protein